MTETHDMTEQDSALPEVRSIQPADLKGVLRRGWRDFANHPTHAVFVAILYPIVGLLVVWGASNRDLIQLAFPLVAGFTLVGPFFALGLYEMSRRIEQSHEVQWQDAFGALRAASLGKILTLGLVLLVIFLAWLAAAAGIYDATMGAPPPASVGAFLAEIFTTSAGWTLIVVGNGVGLLFAVFVLAISVVSFPLILDRNTDVPVAVRTSLKAVLRNPKTMALWGLIIAVTLAVGALPFLFGLAVVFPILGHASWHLYRTVMAP